MIDLLGKGQTQIVLYHDDSGQWEVFAPHDLAKNGRFATQVTNPLGHIIKSSYDAASGAQLSQTDPNQLTTRRQVDGFGRTLAEKLPNGNEARSYIKRCQNDPVCLSGAALVKIVIHAHGSAADSPYISTPAMSYADHAGHDLGSLSGGFDGRGVYLEKQYDALGRLSTTYQPHFERENAILASPCLLRDKSIMQGPTPILLVHAFTQAEPRHAAGCA